MSPIDSDSSNRDNPTKRRAYRSTVSFLNFITQQPSHGRIAHFKDDGTCAYHSPTAIYNMTPNGFRAGIRNSNTERTLIVISAGLSENERRSWASDYLASQEPLDDTELIICKTSASNEGLTEFPFSSSLDETFLSDIQGTPSLYCKYTLKTGGLTLYENPSDEMLVQIDSQPTLVGNNEDYKKLKALVEDLLQACRGWGE